MCPRGQKHPLRTPPLAFSFLSFTTSFYKLIISKALLTSNENFFQLEMQQNVLQFAKRFTNHISTVISSNLIFLEICLIVDGRRVASVIAISYCHTYSLHADDLTIILADHPIMKKTLEQVAADRLKHIGNEIIFPYWKERENNLMLTCNN